MTYFLVRTDGDYDTLIDEFDSELDLLASAIVNGIHNVVYMIEGTKSELEVTTRDPEEDPAW